MPPAPLASLGGLHPDLLYVFVAGPGTGEGIAVALRGSGWLVLDGCAVGGTSVLAEVVHRFRRGDDDPVLAFFLTHPHEDHAGGVPQLLETTEPRSVWVTAKKPEGPHLLEICRRLMAKLERLPTSEQQRLRPVKAALAAIRQWELRTGRQLSCGVDGQVVSLGRPETVRVCAPAAGAHLDVVLEEMAGGTLGRANHASMVVEIVDGPLRLVLGGDLPRTVTGKSTVIPTGWDTVMTTHPHLATHGFLKIAHHGSDAASHSALMAPPPSGRRAWAVTPFDRSGLPRPSTANGVLGAQTPLCVSHPPARWHIGSRAGFRVRIADIADRKDAEPTGIAFADAATDVRPLPPADPLDPLDPLCVFAFDQAGSLQGSWFGASALEIHP